MQANGKLCRLEPTHIHERSGRSNHVSAVASLRADKPQENSKPTGWDRARLGVVLPLGVVVAVAIVCIVVAALTSAQRADEVAIEREKQLLMKGVVNRAEWSLRKLKT